ncbi:hypothetical protein BKG93_11000 [Rodentibacter ratti]|uniref:Adhesin n=1 Tax=Rodentibacter ratti TaxID=1906745 RepID=A0A1V3KZD8_9PAST|nr:YadA-like family protein [Rodentibacter ratti]OOF82680.1 hypothetical protein BKG93_11000 [Rodentibacter ratti]
MKKVFIYHSLPYLALVSTNVFAASLNDNNDVVATYTINSDNTPKIASTATNSIAIGPESSVNQNDAYASASKGRKGRYSGEYSIAEGYNAKVYGSQSVALGYKTQSSGWQTTAIGASAISEGDGSIAIGGEAKNKVGEAWGLPSSGGAVAIGLKSVTNAQGSIAIGNEAKANDWRTIAMGFRAEATVESSVAIGNQTIANGWGATSLGTIAKSYGMNATAIGNDAYAYGTYSSAFGTNSHAEADDTKGYAAALALGANTAAIANRATAIGYNVYTTGNHAISIGSNSGVHQSIPNASGDYSIAFGTDTQAKKDSSIAVGKEAFADHERSVALGDKSTTEEAKDSSQGTVNGITYGNFAGATSVGTVSVGNSKLGETRQIKNVSAGDISPTSTDAINGSQLYLVASKLTEEMKNIRSNPTPVPPPVNVDTGDISVNDNGVAVADSTKGNLANVTNVANAINNSSFNITTGSEESGKAINVKTEKVKAGNTVTYKAGKNMVVKQDGKNITYSTTDKPTFDVVNANEFKAGDVVVNNQGINAGNKKITNVAEGTNDTDAVNYAQLKRTNNQVRQLENKLNRVDRKLRGGIAQAGAMANIPQVTRNGASGVGVGVASYRDENAVSVGYSHMSDNGKHIIKTSVGLDTRGYNMIGAGYMYQW